MSQGKDLTVTYPLTPAISTHAREDEKEPCGWEVPIPKAALEVVPESLQRRPRSLVCLSPPAPRIYMVNTLPLKVPLSGKRCLGKAKG